MSEPQLPHEAPWAGAGALLARGGRAAGARPDTVEGCGLAAGGVYLLASRTWAAVTLASARSTAGSRPLRCPMAAAGSSGPQCVELCQCRMQRGAAAPCCHAAHARQPPAPPPPAAVGAHAATGAPPGRAHHVEPAACSRNQLHKRKSARCPRVRHNQRRRCTWKATVSQKGFARAGIRTRKAELPLQAEKCSVEGRG